MTKNAENQTKILYKFIQKPPKKKRWKKQQIFQWDMLKKNEKLLMPYTTTVYVETWNVKPKLSHSNHTHTLHTLMMYWQITEHNLRYYEQK